MNNLNKITEGNAFALCIRQAVWASIGGDIMPILAKDLTDVHLYIGRGTYRTNAVEYPVTADEDMLIADIDHTLKAGVYSTWITAVYNGRRVASNCNAAFEIVSFDCSCAIAPDKVYGKPSVYLQGPIMTDEELEAYKQQLFALIQERRQEVELLRQQRERLAEVAAQLEDVAKEHTQTELVAKIDLLIESVQGFGANEISEEEMNLMLDEIDNE